MTFFRTRAGKGGKLTFDLRSVRLEGLEKVLEGLDLRSDVFNLRKLARVLQVM